MSMEMGEQGREGEGDKEDGNVDEEDGNIGRRVENVGIGHGKDGEGGK
jgi:hypothetical protein